MLKSTGHVKTMTNTEIKSVIHVKCSKLLKYPLNSIKFIPTIYINYGIIYILRLQV